MKRILLIVAILALFVSYGNAQKINYGVIVGLNVNAARGNQPNGVRLGYSVGATAVYDFKDSQSSWFLGASLMLSQKGYKVDNIYSPNLDGGESQYKSHLDMSSMELPVVVGKDFAVGEKSSIFVEAGPYVSCALWGKSKTTLDGHEEYSTHHVFGNGGYKRVDYGFTFGVGANISDRVRVKCNYELGLPNLIKDVGVYPETVKPTYRNGNIAVTIGYMF